MKLYERSVILIIAAVLYAVLVCILDAIAPLGIEVWVLNLPVMLIPVIFRSTSLLVFLGLACSAMVVVGGVISPSGNNPLSWDILNRSMGIATLWLIAVMAVNIIQRSEQLNEALRRLRHEVAEHGRTGLALQQSEERLRLATEGAGMGTFDVDLLSGRVLWSANHLCMFGLQPKLNPETTMDFWRSCIHPDDRDRVLEEREQALHRHTAYANEYRVKRVDNGDIVWLSVIGRFYHDEAGQAVRFLGVSFDVTRRKELEREVLEIAAREQRQIGQELHDGVGQVLTGLGLMAQSLAERLPVSTAEKGIALRLSAGLTSVHQEVRELSRGLVPVHLESRGLAAALENLAAQTAEASGVEVTAECPKWVELPEHGTGTQLFRIAQEAVSNALRHGRPRHIRVTLLDEPNSLRLRIRDDGIGIRGEPDQQDGLGLRIMQYRAGAIGGALHIAAAPGGGTVVTCTLPRRKGDDNHACESCLAQGESLDRG
jgi:two-component system sensor kinase FixL